MTWLDSFARDVRHAVRGLRRAPVFAFVAVLSLALGIGANTAIFTLIDAVVLRPLPVPAPEELVIFGMSASVEQGERQAGASFPNPLWEQIRNRQTGMSAVAAFSDTRLNLAEGGEARRVRAAHVSGDYFRLFGVNPAHGRLLRVSDDVRGCAPTAVLGHGFWRSEYGGDIGVVGRTIELEGTPFEIIGVAPNGFHGAQVGTDPQVYVPLCSEEAMRGEGSILDRRDTWWLQVMGRRETDVTMAQLGARLAAIAPASFAATVPQDGWGESERQAYLAQSFFVLPAATGVSMLRDRYTGALVILMAGVGLVLLIACANVANLLLARAASREREFAIRAAIGAGRARLARQLVTESILFALMGAALGLVIARFGAQALVALIAQDDGGIALDLSLSARVLTFTTAVAVLTALLFGLVPAWRAGRVDPQTTMSERGRGIAQGHGRFTMGKALVAAQVALSLVLLVGAGLLVGSLRNLVTLDPGFRTDGVLIASADLRPAGFA
ncbi:MAG: ABC transporter permease, partial [Longimicrobiales bacterium]